MQLPDKVYNTLVQLCEAYPFPVVQNEFHIGEILNAVAWAHREDGWGLSSKTSGKHITSPAGLIAEDILQLPDGNHFDVLGGIDVGQPLRPGKPSSIGIINLQDRPWVAPVDHHIKWINPYLPTPDVPPPVTTCKFVDGGCNFNENKDREILSEVKGLSDAFHSLIDQLRKDVDLLRQDVQNIKVPETECKFKLPRW